MKLCDFIDESRQLLYNTLSLSGDAVAKPPVPDKRGHFCALSVLEEFMKNQIFVEDILWNVTFHSLQLL